MDLLKRIDAKLLCIFLLALGLLMQSAIINNQTDKIYNAEFIREVNDAKEDLKAIKRFYKQQRINKNKAKRKELVV